MAAQFIDISTQFMDRDIVWNGPGWYAPHQHYGSDRQAYIRYYYVGNDKSQEPDTYTLGLGTPDWFDQPPA